MKINTTKYNVIFVGRVSIARALHEKIGADIIYFDFAKAFDTVSHDLLLQKLKTQYCIDGRLLKNSLQIICVEGSKE